MRRYALFTHADTYPAGGWNDYRGCFDSVEAALELARGDQETFDLFHVVDLRTGQEVQSGTAIDIPPGTLTKLRLAIYDAVLAASEFKLKKREIIPPHLYPVVWGIGAEEGRRRAHEQLP